MTSKNPYISREQTEELLTCFNEAIKKPKSNPLLFNVWGIGGVGKTTLLDRLEEQHPNISFARVYFGRTLDIHTPLKLMAKLYSDLPALNDWGEDTEEFSELYKKYEQTLEQLKQPDKKESETQATTRKEAIKKLVRPGAIILSQVTPLKDIPGTEEKISSIAEGGLDLVDWLQKQQVTKRNKKLQALMLKPISKLTEAFVNGLIAKSQQKPVVLLLDTYEKTNSEIDNWLWQYLINNSKLQSYSVRVVVAGRKNLFKQESWRKLKQDSNTVYNLEIERFTLEQTRIYLGEINIDESNAIYQITKGLPYYLNWIREQKEKGKELDFSQGNQEVINLLLQGLNKKQKIVIQLAACCRWFNKSLIKYLVTNQKIDFNSEIDTELNCFEWLLKLDFVELTHNTYSLDDVARDVLRISLWQEDRDKFRQVNDLLAEYYEAKAIEEIHTENSLPQIYQNQEWIEYTIEFIYYNLFAKRRNCEKQFLSHLFIACYLEKTEIVSIPFYAIEAEINFQDNILLSNDIKNFLYRIKPIFDAVCLAFEEDKWRKFALERLDKNFHFHLSEEDLDRIIKENNLKDRLEILFKERKISNFHNQLKFKHKYVVDFIKTSCIEDVKKSFQPALKYCFNQIDSLDGFAKFTALMYKAQNSSSSSQLRYLQLAKSQAERMIGSFDSEFIGKLLIWDIGTNLFNLGRYREAIRAFKKALKINPENESAHYCLGTTLGNLGRYREAIRAFKKALKINPENESAHYYLGTTLGNLGRHEEAIKSYEEALKINPENESAHYYLGATLCYLGRHEEAIKSYEEALKINPENDMYYCRIGIILVDLNEDIEAMDYFDRALRINSENKFASKNINTILNKLLKLCEQVLSTNPNNFEALSILGPVLGQLNRNDEAREILEKALKINPNSDDVLSNYGFLLHRMGKFVEAFACYKKALTINDNSPHTFYNLACCFALQNQIQSAIENLEKAVSLDKKYRETAKSDFDFNNIREDSRFQSLIELKG